MILGDDTSFQAALKCCKSTVYYDEDDDEGKLWISDKLSFYNSTPVVQPAAVADATDALSAVTQLNTLLARVRTLGLIAT